MNFFDALLEIINKWQQYPIADEWLFEDFREKFISTMSSEEAFKCISKSIEILLIQKDASTITEVLQTIISLARQSDTTEIPIGLLLNKEKLEDMISNFDEYTRNKLLELFLYFRLTRNP